MSIVELSALDEERFGIRTAKAVIGDESGVREAIESARALGARMFIVRCRTNDVHTAQKLEKSGCELMDVLVYFSRDLQKHPIAGEKPRVTIRTVRESDSSEVAAVARASFAGYFGHYHADPRLDRAKADEVYVSWAHRSCVDREVANEVLIAEHEDEIVGFATLRLNTPSEGEGVLFAVLPSAQGRGIYRSFMLRGMEWCAEQGASTMVVSTQITNIAVQKVWTRLGFEPHKSYLTFHRWFDE
jgi:GNAT superfamily N-acetyltransferase